VNLSSADLRRMLPAETWAGIAAQLGTSALPGAALADGGIVLPWPPSVNRYYRHVGLKVLISREGREFRERVLACLGNVQRMGGGRLELLLRAFPPDRRCRDLDNLFKSTCDALQHGQLYDNDNQIRHIDAWMLNPVRDGCLWVKVNRLEA